MYVLRTLAYSHIRDRKRAARKQREGGWWGHKTDVLVVHQLAMHHRNNSNIGGIPND